MENVPLLCFPSCFILLVVVEQVIISMAEAFLNNKTKLVNQSQNTQVQENRYSHLSSVSCLKDLTFTERILAN